MNKPLTVYKASAGSGKTFTLAVEYISLLIKEPEDYRKILAVTFTNKATQEMKMRILSQLYGIANNLSSSKDYLEQVRQRTGLSNITIRSNAQIVLSLLIHKYNDLRIQTIDAFFQHVLRNLAHELNLTANLRIDLNDEQIESKAVDELIENLEKGQQVLTWIRDYIDENIEEDNGWNVIYKIKKFGNNIFKDFYKTHEKALEKLFRDEKFFNIYTSQLRKRRNLLQKNMNSIAQEILSIVSNANVDHPSFFTRWLYGYFQKRAKGKLTNETSPSYIQSCMESSDKWVSSKCPAIEKEIIINLASSCLCEKLKELEASRLDNWKEYQSISLTLAHLSQLRLLNAISNTVNEINKESNRFMLSNTQSLLKELMVGSDTPFIFEKIGAQLKHIMIDEFQDTSTIQWDNFKILLDNCIAQANSHSLIVGDIKQSIYRWRQGDWQLLNNIENVIPENILELKTLRHNYRSEDRIINFNNTIFNNLVNITTEELKNSGLEEAEILKEAYADVEQIAHKKGNKGCIRIDLLPEDKKTYQQNILQHLSNNVKELLETGHQQKEIAILVRSKGVIKDIADTLIGEFDNKINIVSDEAFRLDASLAVNILIDALHLLTHPNDLLTRGKLVKMYTQKVLERGTTDSETLITLNFLSGRQMSEVDKAKLKIENTQKQISKFNESLPKEFIEQREILLEMPLLDLVDHLFSLFNLDTLKGQSAYICTFYDTLNEYLRDNSADIDDFIKEWENTFSSKTIQSDEIEGIRLITIHKSKGLEFDNVLIPFCDWTLEQNDTIWCDTSGKEAPFNEIPIVPIDFSKNAMKGTVYESDYQHEHFQNTIDNLNLLYVAFTRAGKNLFVSGKRMSAKTLKEKENNLTTNNRSQGIELCLKNITKDLKDAILKIPDSEKEPIHFEYGTLEPIDEEQENSDKKTNKLESNPFLASIQTKHIKIETFPHTVEFRQSNKSHEFVCGEDTEFSDKNKYIKTGNILHELFSTIYSLDDIPGKLNELEQEGIIYNDEITIEKLRKKIDFALQKAQVRDWFSDRWTLFNECTILQYDPSADETLEHRPDRVMTDGNEMIVVDFKFGKEREEYKRQVKRYMQLLADMGHANIKGFLWYVMNGNITEVKL